MTGYLSPKQACAFLGGRSMPWLRSHLGQIRHTKLFDRILFTTEDLVEFVERCGEKREPIDLDAVVASVLGPRCSRPPKGRTE